MPSTAIAEAETALENHANVPNLKTTSKVRRQPRISFMCRKSSFRSQDVPYTAQAATHARHRLVTSSYVMLGNFRSIAVGGVSWLTSTVTVARTMFAKNPVAQANTEEYDVNIIETPDELIGFVSTCESGMPYHNELACDICDDQRIPKLPAEGETFIMLEIGSGKEVLHRLRVAVNHDGRQCHVNLNEIQVEPRQSSELTLRRQVIEPICNQSQSYHLCTRPVR